MRGLNASLYEVTLVGRLPGAGSCIDLETKNPGCSLQPGPRKDAYFRTPPKGSAFGVREAAVYRRLRPDGIIGVMGCDNGKDNDRNNGYDSDRKAQSFADVTDVFDSVAAPRAHIRVLAGRNEQVQRSLRWRCWRFIVSIAQVCHLPSFQQHANAGQVADAHNALVGDYVHHVVFIADVKIRSNHARDTRRGVNFKLAVGLRNLLGLRAELPVGQLQIRLLRSRVVFHDLDRGI